MSPTSKATRRPKQPKHGSKTPSNPRTVKQATAPSPPPASPSTPPTKEVAADTAAAWYRVDEYYNGERSKHLRPSEIVRCQRHAPVSGWDDSYLVEVTALGPSEEPCTDCEYEDGWPDDDCIGYSPDDDEALPSTIAAPTQDPIATPGEESSPKVLPAAPPPAPAAAADGPTPAGAENVTPEGPFSPDGTIEARSVWLDPRAMTEHPFAARWFPDLGTDDDNSELAESIQKRQYKRVIVTGTGCASDINTVLSGRRIRRAALAAGVPVEVVYVNNLTADQEENLIIEANLADQLARKLTERQKASLEQFLTERFARKQGQRSDLLGTSVDSNGGEKGDTRAIVAKKMGETPNAVADRKKVYASPVSSEILRKAVDDGKVSRSAAATKVREVEQRPEVVEALAHAERDGLGPDQVAMLPAIVAAKGVLTAAVLKPRGEPKPKIAKHPMATGTVVDGVCHLDNFLGRRVRVDIHGAQLMLADEGASDNDPSVFVADAPTTRTSWGIDTKGAVDMLAAELRAQVRVGDVEHLDPTRCPSCGGTVWYEVGGCAKCDLAPTADQVSEEIGAYMANRYDIGDRSLASAVRDAIATNPRIGSRIVNLRHPRQRIRITTPNRNVDVVLWENFRDALGPGYDAKPGLRVGDRVTPIDLAKVGDVWSSRQAMRNTVYLAVMEATGALPSMAMTTGDSMPMPGAAVVIGIGEAYIQ